VVLFSVTTFFSLRHALKPTPEQMKLAADMMLGSGEDTGVSAEEVPVTGAASQTAKAYDLVPRGSFMDRLLNWGRWYSWLFWQPFRAAAGSKVLGTIATLTGWVVLGLITVTTIVATMQKRWLWLAMSVYCGVLALGWSNVNARYFVPVAFLCTAGVLLSADQLNLWLARTKWRNWIRWGAITFIGSVALCNGLLYLVEMTVARSPSFAQRYETGINMSLISAGEHLKNMPDAPKDGEIAVSGRYTNLNRSRPSPFALRVIALVTDRIIQTPRYKITDAPPVSNIRNSKLLKNWLIADTDGKVKVKYYLWQPPISPWRVWHFRLGWYEKWQIGKTAEKDESRWRLYRVIEGPIDPETTLPEVRMVEVTVRQLDKYPTRVPGL
jgi:hypothetical protein